MTLYFNEPDHTGHAFGPYDPRGGEIDRFTVTVYYSLNYLKLEPGPNNFTLGHSNESTQWLKC